MVCPYGSVMGPSPYVQWYSRDKDNFPPRFGGFWGGKMSWPDFVLIFTWRCKSMSCSLLKSLKGHPIPRSFPSFHDIQASFISTSHSSHKEIMAPHCTHIHCCYLLLFSTAVWACVCEWMASTWNIPLLIAMCCLWGPLHNYCYWWVGKGKLTQGATLLGRLKPLSLFADRDGLCYPGYASFLVVNSPGENQCVVWPFQGLQFPDHVWCTL